jgi:hypothetical protein
MRALCLTALVASLAAASPLRADDLFVPTAAPTTPGDTARNTLTRESPETRALQFIVAPSALAQLPRGSSLVGISFRRASDGGVAWPGASVTYTSFDITVAAAARTPVSPSTTFATNVGADAVSVRTGALTLNAGAFPPGGASGTPSAWGSVIPFLRPYTYEGTGLVVTIRHTGHSGGANNNTQLDSIGTGAAGFGSSFWAMSATTSTATTGTASPLPVIRLSFRPADHPTKLYSPEFATRVPGSSNLSTLLSSSSRTYQQLIAPYQLTPLPPGSIVTGLAYRTRSLVPWPTTGFNFTSYEIQLAQAANAPAARSSTFTDNVGAFATTTRSGVLAVAANTYPAMPASGDPAPFAPPIVFTSPYEHKGESLVVTVRHSGNGTGQNVLLDTASSDDPGYGVSYSAHYATSNIATASGSGLSDSATIMRLDIQPATVTPSGFAGIPGGITAPNLISRNVTSQMIIAASQLTTIPVGSTIGGLSLRLGAGQSTFPASADWFYSQFDVQLASAARTPATMSTTIATNLGADATLVRSGPLVIRPGAFTGGSSPNAWGATIAFPRPFVYKGGDLAIVIRHSPTRTNETPLADHVSTANAGYGTLFRHLQSTSTTATTTTSTAAMPVLRLHFTPSQVIPADRADSLGDSTSAAPFTSGAGTLQLLIAGSELAERSVIQGSILNGLSFRISGLGTARTPWPPAGLSWSRFDVTVASSARTPAAMSTVFGENLGPDGVLVRSGPLELPTNSLEGAAASGTTASFTYTLAFSRPVVYAGGDIVITIRHSGSASGFVPDLDAAASPANGVGTRVRALGTTSAEASTGTFGPFPIMRLAYTVPSVCPSDFNRDGFADFFDFDDFVACFDNPPDCLPGTSPDLNLDGFVDFFDFDDFVREFDRGC